MPFALLCLLSSFFCPLLLKLFLLQSVPRHLFMEVLDVDPRVLGRSADVPAVHPEELGQVLPFKPLDKFRLHLPERFDVGERLTGQAEPDNPRSMRRMVSPFSMITARSMMFSSSRTLPGKEYLESDDSTWGERDLIVFWFFSQYFLRKWEARSGTSSTRWRRGGSFKGTTLSRKKRSSRNVCSLIARWRSLF